MTDILVLDLETTGLDGFDAGDEIVQIGLVSVNTATQDVTPVLSMYVQHDLTEEQRHSFIFTDGGMDVDLVLNSPFDEEKAAVVLANIIDGEYLTTYNTEFDLDRFLLPWFDAVIPELRDLSFFRAPCLMKACAQVEDIPRKVHDVGCYPSLRSSYYTLCHEYADIMVPHRALDDCILAGRVLIELYEHDLYDPESEEEY